MQLYISTAAEAAYMLLERLQRVGGSYSFVSHVTYLCFITFMSHFSKIQRNVLCYLLLCWVKVFM
jgi:hypothetical protein